MDEKTTVLMNAERDKLRSMLAILMVTIKQNIEIDKENMKEFRSQLAEYQQILDKFTRWGQIPS
jgi:uncharacterized membrane protein (DUF106 family)